MANLSLFTRAETFRRMKPEYLRRWLEPSRAFLLKRGVTLPENGAAASIEYDRLAGIFLEPDAEMPRDLMHSATLIHEMSTVEAMSDLLDMTRQLGLKLDLGDDPHPVDVAVQVWLHQPKLLEEAHQLHELDRPRGFTHFIAAQDTLPKFEKPTEAQTRGLEAELADWFFHAKRGRHARVWTYLRPGEHWFLVRHGLTSRGQEVVSATGTDTLIFRPGEYDVLVFNRESRELRIHGCGQREVEMLRRTFGKHFFGDKDFFPGGARFTLTPLIASGRASLACKDIPGIDEITLVEVQAFTGGRDWLRVRYHAGDLFNLIEDETVVLPDKQSLVRASFLVRFTDAKKQRTVKILGVNKLSVRHDSDTPLVKKWMEERGFLIKRTAKEDGPGAE